MDSDLVVKICRLYYEQGLSQTQISERLRISRFRVARALVKARQKGIVQIRVAAPTRTQPHLEDFLEQAFGLRRAIVVTNADFSDQELKQQIAIAAASYLQEIVRDGDILGISWGSTVNEVAKALPIQPRRIQVVQINGGSRSPDVNIECNEITRLVAGKFSAPCHLLYAPLLADSKAIRDAILADSSVRSVLELCDRLDIALLGVGSLSPEPSPTLLRAGNISESEFRTLSSRGMVGDIFYHAFDVNGRIDDELLGDRIVAISLDQLRRVPCPIGVAGGRAKASAILGALRTGLLKVLVTDSVAAEAIRASAA